MGPNLSTSAVEGEEEGIGKDERRGVSERARWCVCVCVCEREGGREGGREGEREREREREPGGGREIYAYNKYIRERDCVRKRGIEREGEGATKTEREEGLDVCQMQRVAEMGNILKQEDPALLYDYYCIDVPASTQHTHLMTELRTLLVGEGLRRVKRRHCRDVIFRRRIRPLSHCSRRGERGLSILVRGSLCLWGVGTRDRSSGRRRGWVRRVRSGHNLRLGARGVGFLVGHGCGVCIVVGCQ